MLHKDELDDRYLRIKKSHMSLQRLISYLKKAPMPKLRKIILVHLSTYNANAELMVNSIRDITGCSVVAASGGDVISLDYCVL
jgi:phosphoribosyl 1,2-cyclic phosphodiesterase